MAVGTMVFKFLDDIPKSTREGAGRFGKQQTDLDVALDKLVADHFDGVKTPVVQILDYHTDDEGNPVEDDIARKRATGRVAQIKGRGRTIEEGWVVLARNGGVYVQYFGKGNVPAEYLKKVAPVGEDIPV